MNPAPDLVKAIVAAVGANWDLPPDQILASLRGQLVPNPVPPQTEQKPFKFKDVYSAIQAVATKKALAQHPKIDRIMDDINSGDPDRIESWITLLSDSGAIGAADVTAIRGVVSATQPRAGYRPQINVWERDWGRDLDLGDILEARRAAGK